MNVFDLYAKIALDTGGYEKGLEDASGKTSDFADKLKSGLATAAKVGAAALTAASTALGALTKQSIEGYAEYEQLVGGVETLFKTSADVVQEYAANAYKTAGLSANEYMETVTSFSASLLQSLDNDTAAAAEKADLAITDMSDNANKMGTSMESIQNAYQGFAKQNYTMLDNLKLGYGGTKEEMGRLLEYAEKLAGLDPFSLNINSFDDIVTAIHIVQTEMGITGTTALEASTTIQGSVSAMKSAWSNLVAGIADENADLDTLIGNVVTSAETAAENIIPRITQILSGMGAAIQQLAPILAAEVPALIASVLPSLVSAGAQLLVGITTGLIGALPQLAASVPQIVTEVYNSLVAAGPQLVTAGNELLTMLGDGIITYVPELIARLPEVITEIYNFMAENAPKFIESGLEFVGQLALGIINAIPDMVAKLPDVINAIVNYITSVLPVIVKKGSELLGKLTVGILSAIPDLVAALPQIIAAIVEGIGALMGSIVDIGKNVVKGIWEGITSMGSWLGGKVSGFFGGIVDGAKNVLGIHSPSKVFAQIGNNMAKGLWEGWNTEYIGINKAIENGFDFERASILGTSNPNAVGKGTGMISSQFSTIGDIVLNITSEIDGAVLSHKMYRYNIREGKNRGSSLVNV